MKTEHWVMFFFAIFFVFYVTFIWHIELVDMQTDENRQHEDALIEACKDGLYEADLDDTLIFADEETRENALAKFKASFNYSFDYEGYHTDDINYLVPFIMLVDDNGYYMNYSKLVNDGTLSRLVNVTSELNTWTKIYGNYIVQYHLSDTVDVTYITTGKVVTGTPTEVYNKLSTPSQLSFFAYEDQFEEERNHIVTSITEENINYYITTHNEYANSELRKYKFTMPTADSYESRLMDAPSVIAFVQGTQASNVFGYVNVYAYTASIKDIAIDYYEYTDTQGNKYYHKKNCSNLVIDENNDTPLTMDDCAADGYIPCPDCIK